VKVSHLHSNHSASRRTHDARHTASTVLLLLGVPERIVMAIMGWSSTSMAQRYQHVTEPMLNDVGKKVGVLLWGKAEEQDVASIPALVVRDSD
jgi:integrase